MESMLIFERTSSRSACLFIILSFLFLSLSFNAYSNDNQNSFYGIKTDFSFEETFGYRSAVKTFWKDKTSVLNQARKWNSTKIKKMMEKTYKLELELKSNSLINHNILIKKLIVDICNVANS